MKDYCGTKRFGWLVPENILGLDLAAPCFGHDLATRWAKTLADKRAGDLRFRRALINRSHTWELKLRRSGNVLAAQRLGKLLYPIKWAVAWSYYLAVASPLGVRHWENLRKKK